MYGIVWGVGCCIALLKKSIDSVVVICIQDMVSEYVTSVGIYRLRINGASNPSCSHSKPHTNLTVM